MPEWLTLCLTALASIFASSGFWAFMQSRDKTKSATDKLLMGLAYNQLVTKGIEYIERGWVTKDEFEEYEKYYFKPYKALGGNGVAERIWSEVLSLPFHSKSKYEEILNTRKNEEFINHVRVHVPEASAE